MSKKGVRAQVVYTPETYAKLQKVATDMDMSVSALCKSMIAIGLHSAYDISLSAIETNE